MFDWDWFAVEQARRVLESLGWKIISQDSSGEELTLIIKKQKKTENED